MTSMWWGLIFFESICNNEKKWIDPVIIPWSKPNNKNGSKWLRWGCDKDMILINKSNVVLPFYKSLKESKSVKKKKGESFIKFQFEPIAHCV